MAREAFELPYNDDGLSASKNSVCKYQFYKNMIQSKGYMFYKHEGPFDFYSNGNDKLMVCEPCRKLMVNDKRLNQPGEDILRPLIKFLFNQKPAS